MTNNLDELTEFFVPVDIIIPFTYLQLYNVKQK